MWFIVIWQHSLLTIPFRFTVVARTDDSIKTKPNIMLPISDWIDGPCLYYFDNTRVTNIQLGMSPWWPLPGLLCWRPIIHYWTRVRNILCFGFRLHFCVAGIFLYVLWNVTLRWRHDGGDSVSNHQPHDCLLSRLFRRRSQKTSKLHVTGLCAGNSPGTDEFPAQMASNAENVFIWWRHHEVHHRHRVLANTRQLKFGHKCRCCSARSHQRPR